MNSLKPVILQITTELINFFIHGNGALPFKFTSKATQDPTEQDRQAYPKLHLSIIQKIKINKTPKSTI